MRFSRFAAVVMLSVLAGPVLAEPPLEKEPVKLATQVYDCRTLLAPIPDYPLDPAILPAAAREQLRRESRNNQPPVEGDPGRSAESISRLIQETVAPETWRDQGGAIGNIRPAGSTLVVTQTEANQQRVAAVLSQMKDEYLATVHVEATWLL